MKTIHRWVLSVALILASAAPAAAQGQTFQQGGTISTAGADCSTATNCVAFSTEGVPAFGVPLNFGTSATLVFEVSPESGSTANDGTWYDCDTAAGCLTEPTADGMAWVTNKGFKRFRARASAIDGALAVGTPVRGSPVSGSTSGSLVGATTPADNFANPTDAVNTAGFMMCWDGATWDRCPVGDGGIGSSSSNTSRIVEANATGTYVADLDESEDEIDDNSGVFCGFMVDSLNTDEFYIQGFDADADDVTVGTTPATWVFGIPEASASGMTTAIIRFPACIAYSNALSLAATTTRTGNTGPSAIVAITAFTR
jgi:hypothetical protein